MKYSIVNGNKMEAQPGLQGTCALCQSVMIAKCGKVKIRHWAHKSKISCDPWWENETEWHRTWKNHFPTEWQEVIRKDPSTGEKHIADIKTDKEFIIEFQHSAIKSSEVQSREAFYKNMVWVVDGTRLKKDYERFNKGKNNFRDTGKQGFFFAQFLDECFPKDWIESSVPVIFDFMGSTSSANPRDIIRDTLWCLLPGRAEGYAVICGISREDFVNRILAHPQLFPDPAYMLVNAFAENLRQQRRMNEQMLRRGNRHFRF